MLEKFSKLIGKKVKAHPSVPGMFIPEDAPLDTAPNNNIPMLDEHFEDPNEKYMEYMKAHANTKSFRNFCFTVYTEERWNKIFEYLKSKKNCKYIIAGREICPSTGRKHFQCYCNFSKPTKLNYAKMQYCWVQTCKGTPEDNIKYCSKYDKNPIIWGDAPTSIKIKSIKDMKNLDDNELDNMSPIYYNIIEKYKQQRENKLTLEDLDYKNIKVVYIWGLPDMGKTDYAKCLMKRYMIINRIEEYNEVKYTNDFWNNKRS